MSQSGDISRPPILSTLCRECGAGYHTPTLQCETCQGKRFNRETLEIRYKGKSISDVLNMTINEAVEFFEHIPKINRKLKTIKDVDASGLWPAKAVTKVTKAQTFWQAEVEHQDYLERIPNGYTCHFARPDWVLESN